jgi:hypothetical protein
MDHDPTPRMAAARITIESGFSSDWNPAAWFRAALAMSQAANGTDSRANRHPAGFACHARPRFPRTIHAYAVVMPHVGHNCPVDVR